MHPESFAEITRRLEGLERSNRRLKRGLAALLSLTGLLGLVCLLGPGSFSCSAGGNAPAGDVLRAKRIEVVNEKGVPVIALSADARGWGKIVTYREDQTQLVQMASTDDGGTVAVAGAKGSLRAALAVAKQDYGTVFTLDGKNTRLITLATAAFGDGAVLSYDRVGNVKKMWP
jgi:hypothetical protein